MREVDTPLGVQTFKKNKNKRLRTADRETEFAFGIAFIAPGVGELVCIE